MHRLCVLRLRSASHVFFKFLDCCSLLVHVVRLVRKGYTQKLYMLYADAYGIVHHVPIIISYVLHVWCRKQRPCVVLINS